MPRMPRHILIVLLSLLCGPAQVLAAACSPGIPCTSYTVGAGDTAVHTDNPETCDSDFMNQITARAFLEAEREVVMNSAVMRKPDSVLEYSCFTDYLADTALIAGPLFAESDAWHPRTVNIGTTTVFNITMDTFMGDLIVDDAIQFLILESLEDYITNNFDHDFLGGAAGFNNTLQYTPASYSPSPCNHMQNIWSIAKCNNFGEFYSFEDLVTTDPRDLPTACGGTTITTAIIDVARNDNFTYAATLDQMTNNYFDLMLGVGTPIPGGGSAACGTPIPTGVQVTLYNYTISGTGVVTQGAPDVYADKVCSNPSCYYDFSGDTCNP